jgi:beta-lactamase regulating signal transducer with metallopeptidase domain
MFITGHSLAILFAAFESLTRSLPNDLSAAFPAISQTAGALLITAIWQGAIVAVCLALSLRLASRISAGLRFTLWIGGFLAVTGLPFLPLIFRVFAHPVLQSGGSLASAPRFSVDARWSIAICLLWAAVSLYRALDLAAHTLRLRSLWTSATPIESIAAPARLRGRRAIQICTTDALDRPSVIGFFAPRILIPAWLLPKLTPGELDQILLHETEHLRRGDDWTNLLQKLSLILFPLNPVLLWMERQLCLEREMACDEAVIRVTRAPRAYAACLTTLAERGIAYRSQSSEALSLGAWQRRPELVHRVHSLLRVQPALGPWCARGLTAALACGLAVGSVELAHCPQLVAFVPAHPAESAQTTFQPLRSSHARSREVLTAWKSDTPERGSHPYMTNLRATVPDSPNPQAYSDAWESNSTRTSALKLATEPAPRLAHTPRQTMLKAEHPSASSAPEQSWIVFTTWEEVAASSPNPTPGADFGESQAAPVEQAVTPAAAENPGQNQIQQPGQIKVTRMIFRVIPAGFVTSSPTAYRTRDGWLVIQM